MVAGGLKGRTAASFRAVIGISITFITDDINMFDASPMHVFNISCIHKVDVHTLMPLLTLLVTDMHAAYEDRE